MNQDEDPTLKHSSNLTEEPSEAPPGPHRVTFVFHESRDTQSASELSTVTCEVEFNEKLTAAAHKCQAPLRQSCGGKAKCTDCLVRVRSGYEHLSDPTKEEIFAIGNVSHITKERLACQCLVRGPLEVEIPLATNKIQRRKNN